MLHWQYVGHFDPLNRLDKTVRPFKPKVIRPISEETVLQYLSMFGEDISEYVTYFPEGYILCNWSIAPGNQWERVQRFAYSFADAEKAVVMDEGYSVEHPPEARGLFLAKCNRKPRAHPIR